MDNPSMTALISAFARAYHTRHSTVKVYDDPLAQQLFSREEYDQIAQAMTGGISYFCPGFSGDAAQALGQIVDHQLAPTPLGRAAFGEQALQSAAKAGARQYLILGAGYDTFPYRQPSWARALQIFEVDCPATLKDKALRLERAGISSPSNLHRLEADVTSPSWPSALTGCPAFRSSRLSFCGAMGLSYYLTPADFRALVDALSTLCPPGSQLAFDYPVHRGSGPDQRSQMQSALAAGAGETMLAVYSPREMEELLLAHGFHPLRQLSSEEVTQRYFSACNRARAGAPVSAFAGVYYCLAVRR